MQKVRAFVVEEDDTHVIKIGEDGFATIPISEDDPKKVKRAFNKLLLRLREGVYEIKIQDETEDLFSQVAIEYIKQLNGELREVYEEMEDQGLIET